EVGRYASYNTAASRTLIISGLDNSKRYDFEAYASRIGGNQTRYVVGSSSITINTDRNYVNKASFTNLTPVSGRITITLERITTYTYINGFTLTENGGGGTPVPNQPPVARAGNDINLVLPANSSTLNGSTSSDPDGTIASYNWTKLSGPASFTINNATIANPLVSNLATGTYLMQLTVTDNNGASSMDSVNITVYPSLNTAPVARAGADQTIVLPVNSVTLNGSASSDAVGQIVSYVWRQISGPSASTLGSANAVSTTAADLVTGAYQFELLVTDDSSAVGKDTIVVTVNPVPPAQRFVRVNIFGGSNPAGTGWNNWNVQTSLSTGALSYSDGTASAITAALSAHTNIGDNGAGYPTTMCPPEVGRIASYNTNASRTLTISGLDNSKTYDFEAYASRIGGNQTRYVVGSTSITINTDRNYVNKASFSNLTPVAGRITITLERITTFTYINGFTLTENSSAQGRSAGQLFTSTTENNEIPAVVNPSSAATGTGDATVSLFPNPAVDHTAIQVLSSREGQVKISLLNESGTVAREWQWKKEKGLFQKTISLTGLKKGIYLLQVKMGNWEQTKTIIKL
ncbi:MAG: T9SS type A sorting domain-containing protein, partial [Chitinophagales bacterium]|nr:T9SS type A sorting domain-containing protein [Chitinophagales bacterium]